MLEIQRFPIAVGFGLRKTSCYINISKTPNQQDARSIEKRERVKWMAWQPPFAVKHRPPDRGAARSGETICATPVRCEGCGVVMSVWSWWKRSSKHSSAANEGEKTRFLIVVGEYPHNPKHTHHSIMHFISVELILYRWQVRYSSTTSFYFEICWPTFQLFPPTPFPSH